MKFQKWNAFYEKNEYLDRSYFVVGKINYFPITENYYMFPKADVKVGGEVGMILLLLYNVFDIKG